MGDPVVDIATLVHASDAWRVWRASQVRTNDLEMIAREIPLLEKRLAELRLAAMQGLDDRGL